LLLCFDCLFIHQLHDISFPAKILHTLILQHRCCILN
jgi:hypothetical protein